MLLPDGVVDDITEIETEALADDESDDEIVAVVVKDPSDVGLVVVVLLASIVAKAVASEVGVSDSEVIADGVLDKLVPAVELAETVPL